MRGFNVRANFLYPCLVLTVLTPGPVAARPVSQSSADTLRYVYLTQGNPAGEQTVWRGPDNSIHAHFEFNDRGRGPLVDTRIVLDESGLPRSIDGAGNDYYKVPVEEHFSVSGDIARWESSTEVGSQSFGEGAFYLSMNAVPEESAILVRALLATPDRRLRLLPAGEARLDAVAEEVVSNGRSDRTLTLWAIRGLALTPSYIWLDSTGEHFATTGLWNTVILQGWESVVPRLIAVEQEVAGRRMQEMAQRLTDRPDGPVALINARLFDSESGTIQAGMTVLVSGNRIEAVGEDGSVSIPDGTRVIDAAGKTLLPGLFDMHAHASDVDGPLNIAAGITSVRDLANDTDAILTRRARWDEQSAIGPRVVLGGFMDGPGPFAGPTKVLVDTAEEIREAIDTYADLGYVQIKMYSSILTELVPVITGYAHERGLRVSGHIPSFMTAAQAVEQGFDEIQHVNMLFLNFRGDTLDTRTPKRFTEVAAHAAELDLESDSVQAFVQLLLDNDVVIDPTVTIFESMFTARQGVVDPTAQSISDRLPPLVARGYLSGGLPVPEGLNERHLAARGAMLAMVKMLFDAGVPIVAGTDALAGFMLHRELELYAEAGIPEAEVLKIATSGAARIAGLDDEVGRIAPGMLADMILVDGNPTVNMSDIRKVDWVMKDGVIFDPSALYQELGVRPWRDTPIKIS